MNQKVSSGAAKAFTVIEAVIVVAILGLLSTTVFNVYGKINQVAHQEKLRSEVKTLNNAVKIYQGFGGKFDGISDPAEVIGKLKSVAHSEIADRIPGLNASMVDARLSVRMQSSDEAESGEARVVWDASTHQFVVAKSGGQGISSFGLDANPEEIPEIDQRELVQLYAKNSTWVWDFEESSMPVIQGPTAISTISNEEVDDSLIPIDEIPDPVGPLNKEGLDTPTLSPPPNSYSIRDFDLPVEIVNPNNPGISRLYYSVDFGPWEEYSGEPVILAPESSIAAQVIPKYRRDYHASAMNRGEYEALPVLLSPPVIDTSVSSFGAFSDRYVSVTLTDPNQGDPSYIEYRVSYGPWQVYDGPFLVDSEIYEADVLVESRSRSDNSFYQTSENSSSLLDYIPFSVEGVAFARFHTAYGPYGAWARQTEYNNFYWGRIYDNYGRRISGLTESYLEFVGEENNDTEFGLRFDLGSLDYYNGAILANTGATSVKLDLDLDLVISGYDASTNFTFDFDLVNTDNYGNYTGTGYDAWRSADYVEIRESSQTNFFSLQGTLLAFTLEFGDASEYGFAEFDEFHVLEQRAADTRVYGTLRLATEGEND